MVELSDIYKKFPTRDLCISHLEKTFWKGKPVCPYCHSDRHTIMPKEKRYHCNNCNRSYSATVKTIFHKTKIDLQKWFYAFMLIVHTENITTRQLAAALSINKNSAHLMLKRIKKAIED